MPHAGPLSRDLKGHASALSVDIRMAGILLEQAAQSGRRWLEGLRCSPEYTAFGGHAELHNRGRVSFTG